MPPPRRQEPRAPGRHRKKGPPRRRVNPRYVTAAVFTAFLAVPALWMADYIATHQGAEQTIELVKQNAHVPMTLYENGTTTPICVYVSNGKNSWKAWATKQNC